MEGQEQSATQGSIATTGTDANATKSTSNTASSSVQPADPDQNQIDQYIELCLSSWIEGESEKLKQAADATLSAESDTSLDVRLPHTTGSNDEQTDSEVSFSKFSFLVLKQVHPDTGITQEGSLVLEDILQDLLQRIATTSAKLVSSLRKDWVAPDWRNAHIIGENGKNRKLLIQLDGEKESNDDLAPSVMWYRRESLGAEMHDKLISWDSQTEEDKLTVLRQLVFKAGDKQNVGEKCRSNFTFPGTITALDIQKAIPKELPGELTKHAVSETKKSGIKFQSCWSDTEYDPSTLKTMSKMAGLVFPVEQVGSLLRKITQRTVTARAAVYMSSVLEYICAEILELSGNQARDANAWNINARHIFLAIANDEELAAMLPISNVCIMKSGVLPNILNLFCLPERKYRVCSNNKDERASQNAIEHLKTAICQLGGAKELAVSPDMNANIGHFVGEDFSDAEITRSLGGGAKKKGPGSIEALLNLQGMDILAARAGILRINSLALDELRSIATYFLQELCRNAVAQAELAGSKVLHPGHVIEALEDLSEQGGNRTFSRVFGTGLIKKHTPPTDLRSDPVNVPVFFASHFPELIFDWDTAFATAAAGRRVHFPGEDETNWLEEETKSNTDDEDESDSDDEDEYESDEDEDEVLRRKQRETIRKRHKAALKVIRYEQNSDNPISKRYIQKWKPGYPFIPYSEFSVYVGSLVGDHMITGFHSCRIILEALQKYLIRVLQGALLCAIHRERITKETSCTLSVEEKDIKLAKYLGYMPPEHS